VTDAVEKVASGRQFPRKNWSMIPKRGFGFSETINAPAKR
jgi:hypothetical protein